ncbi:SurA N-terminal domain-containing protein [Oceanospirillum maris]|uniref:SurA N-terminal domain-containing protein n=1 Tax=Oceanospirillum maris TaxID=64977 RepID=UPI0004275875|nr:SurA N-terminal domain-containing protein [Oceanospirillum maris]
MLQNIRDKSSSWVVKVIVGFIILTFAMFGLDAIVGAFTGGSDEVATVNDAKISRYDLETATQRQVRQVLSQMGPDADPSNLNENLIRQRALQGLIDREAALQAAQEGGLVVSELQIDRLILSTPEFRGPDGQFSPDQFNTMLRTVGMMPRQFREELRKDVLINQFQGGVSLSEFLPKKYVEQVMALDSQTRDISYVALKAEQQLDVSVSDADVESYYQDNRTLFSLPERVQLNYIRISQDDFLADATVTDAELESAYNRYEQTSRRQASYYASHILLDTEERSQDEAVAELNALKKRIDEGASFAELAKEFSDDIGSSANGGKLGLVEPDSFDADFEQALFSLEEGGVSDPVVTEFGVHLVYLDKKELPVVASLDEMKPTLLAELKANKAAKKYLLMTEELANAAFASSDLQAPAEEFKLDVESTALFSAQGGEGIASHPSVIRAAFSEVVKDNGENSDLIELDDKSAVVIRAAVVKAPSIQPLEEVAEQISQKLTLEKQVKAVEKQAETLIASAGEAGLVNVAETAKLTVETVAGVSRVDQSVPRAVVQQAFSQAEGSVKQVVSGDVVYLVQVTGVAQPEISEEFVAFYEQAIRLSQARNTVQQVRASVASQADITRL